MKTSVLIISIILNIIMAYKIIDQAVTIDHLSQSVKYLEKDLQQKK